eukprot:scaffold17869_cov104-Isochrysis_galbana.AAC.7
MQKREPGAAKHAVALALPGFMPVLVPCHPPPQVQARYRAPAPAPPHGLPRRPPTRARSHLI